MIHYRTTCHLQQEGYMALEGLHRDTQTPLLGYVQEERERQRKVKEVSKEKGEERKNRKVKIMHIS
jgi:hypothetical protein